MKLLKFIPFLLFSLSPWCSSPMALALGMLLGLGLQWPLHPSLKNGGKLLMQISIVGLGFALDPTAVQKAGTQSIIVTLFSLVGIMAVAFFVSKLLKINAQTGSLIAAGTGICGGSAIAAMSPVVGATSAETAVALATVFSLNAIALFIFPPRGHFLQLTPEQFGWWAAIAIHDTSSVVGAAAQFHPDSVAIAVTTKLTRALWIVPMVFGTSYFLRWKEQQKLKNLSAEELAKQDIKQKTKASVPLFIFLFVAAVIVHALIPDMPEVYATINVVGKAILKAAIFLIGAQLTRNMLRSVGIKAMALGIILWIFMAGSVLSWVRTI